jgi:flagellar basal-body rod protein FlgF
MDNGIYSLIAGVTRNSKNLEIQANNLANMNTPGFKEDFQLHETKFVSDGKNKVAIPVDSPSIINDGEGPIVATLRPLDVALVGSGYFKIATPNGVRYSRNGGFTIDNEGRLVTHQGNPVLSADGQEIVFEAADTDPIILGDGTVLVDGEERGRIGAVTFENPKLLRKLGNNLFIADQDEIEALDTKFLQGSIEQANVRTILAVTNLIEIQRKQELMMDQIMQQYNNHRAAFKVYSNKG